MDALRTRRRRGLGTLQGLLGSCPREARLSTDATIRPLPPAGRTRCPSCGLLIRKVARAPRCETCNSVREDRWTVVLLLFSLAMSAGLLVVLIS